MEDFGRVELVNQPGLSRICGQCCVAMLTGVSLRKVINLVGHGRGTRTKELVKVIRRLGYDCDSRLRHAKKLEEKLVRVDRALVKLTISFQKNWHWLAWADGKVYDPGSEKPLRVSDVFGSLLTRPTSFLEIKSGSGWAPVRTTSFTKEDAMRLLGNARH